MSEDGKRHCMNCAFGWCCSHPDVKEERQLFAMSWGHDCEFYKQKQIVVKGEIKKRDGVERFWKHGKNAQLPLPSGRT